MFNSLFDSPWKILIVAVLILVLFGSRKLPEAARSLGKSMRILRAEVQALPDDDAAPAGAALSPGARAALDARRAAQATPAGQAGQAGQATPADTQARIDALQRQLDELKARRASA